MYYKAFPKQQSVQAAMVAAVPPLADSYATRQTITSDGLPFGPIWPLRIDPGASLRRKQLPSRPASGFPFF